MVTGIYTDPDGSVAMSSANGLVGTGSNTERVFKGRMGRCMATVPSSPLTSNRITTNLLS